ncbi:MAG: AsmA family protein [Pseudomonadota bacterium]
MPLNERGTSGKMRRRGGWLIAAIVVIFLLAGLPLAASLYLDSTHFRSQVQRVLSERAGRPVSLHGPLRVTLAPDLQVILHRLAVPAGPGFAGDLLQVEQVRLSLAWWPWLRHRQLVFDAIELDRPVLRLQQDTQGRDNWRSLLHALFKPSAEPSALRALGTLRLRDGELRWQTPQRTLVLHRVQAQAGPVRKGQGFPVRFSGGWQGWDRRGDWTLNGRVQPGWADKRYALENARLLLTLAGAAPVQLRLHAPALAQAASGDWRAPVLFLAAERQGRRLSAQADLLYQPAAGRLQLARLRADLGGDARAHGALRVDGLPGQPLLQAQLSLPPFNPRRLAAYWQHPLPPSRDPEAWSHAAVAALSVRQDNPFWELRVRGGELDRSRVTGEAAVRLAPFFARFDAQVDQLTVDGYLPAAKVAAGPPRMALPDWPLAGEVRVDRFRSGQMRGRGLRLGWQGGDWHAR